MTDEDRREEIQEIKNDDDALLDSMPRMEIQDDSHETESLSMDFPEVSHVWWGENVDDISPLPFNNESEWQVEDPPRMEAQEEVDLGIPDRVEPIEDHVPTQYFASPLYTPTGEQEYVDTPDTDSTPVDMSVPRMKWVNPNEVDLGDPPRLRIGDLPPAASDGVTTREDVPKPQEKSGDFPRMKRVDPEVGVPPRMSPREPQGNANDADTVSGKRELDLSDARQEGFRDQEVDDARSMVDFSGAMREYQSRNADILRSLTQIVLEGIAELEALQNYLHRLR